MTSLIYALCFISSLLFVFNSVDGQTNNDLKDCQGPFDIVILLDSSVSLRDSDPYDRPLQTWNLMKNFSSTFLQRLPEDKNIKLAVVQYSTTPQIAQPLTSRQGYSSSNVNSLSFIGHNTNTAAALFSAKAILASSTSRKIVLLMTDGLSTIDIDSTLVRAQELKDAQVELYALGISNYMDSAGLAKIASAPASKYLIQLVGQSQLDNIVDLVARRVCNLPDPTPAPPVPCKTVPNCNQCLSDSRRCEVCQDGHYREGWGCQPCSPNCINCQSGSSCIDCAIGYFKDPTTGNCLICSQGVYDLAFLIDSSGSIRDKNKNGVDNYLVILHFVQLVIDGLPVSENQTRVAVISFSNTARVHFNLSRYYDRDQINNQVGVTPYEGAFTNISGAFKVLRQEIWRADRGDRPSVPNVCVLVTDGESTKDQDQTIPEANASKASGTKVFAVGVTTEINRNELYQIVSPPIDKHFFYSDDIINLKRDVLDALRDSLCTTSK